MTNLERLQAEGKRFAALMDVLFAPFRAELSRYQNFRITPLAANTLALVSKGASDQEREAAVRWLREWVGPSPIHPRRHAQLLGELRRSGFLGSAAHRALEERLLAAIVTAVTIETLGPCCPADPDLKGAVRNRVAKEMTDDILGPDRQRPKLDAEIAARIAAGTTQPAAQVPRAVVSAALARLTPRERHILTLMGRGLPDAAIALRLKIARSTVRVLRARATKTLAKTRR